MQQSSHASFWQTKTTAHPVERRLLWQFGKRRGELTVFIHPNQPVPNLTDLSERAATHLTLEQGSLRPDQPIAPGFVFAGIGKSPTTGTGVVIGPGGREIPVVVPPESAADSKKRAHTMQDRMDQTGDAMPPAQVAPGDAAVGLLVRQDILFLYPVVAVGTEAEIEAYSEGAGTTNDLIHELPFQS